MIHIDYVTDPSPPVRSAVEAWIRALVPFVDPDGRGRLEVRLSAPAPDRQAIEVACGGLTTYAVDADPLRAIDRAFAGFGDAWGVAPTASVG